MTNFALRALQAVFSCELILSEALEAQDNDLSCSNHKMKIKEVFFRLILLQTLPAYISAFVINLCLKIFCPNLTANDPLLIRIPAKLGHFSLL